MTTYNNSLANRQQLGLAFGQNQSAIRFLETLQNNITYLYQNATPLNGVQLCQTKNASVALQVYGPLPAGTHVSIVAASAWNPTTASANAVVDLFIVPTGGAPGDATHIDRVSVPPGSTLTLTNAINHQLTQGMSLYASTNGATLTISGAVAS